MATQKKDARIVKEIAKKYGNVIDLNESPMVLLEILRNYGGLFIAPSEDPTPGVGGTGGTGTGGTGTGGTGTVSSIAVAGPPSSQIQLSDVLQAVLHLQGDVKAANKILNRLAKPTA